MSYNINGEKQAGSLEDLLEDAYRFIIYLEKYNSTHGTSAEHNHELTLRLAKVAEEAGEVIQARIAQTGQNPRKAGTKTIDDVILELCDVVFTAFVAMLTISDNPDTVARDLHQRFSYIVNRAGLE